MTSVGIHGIGTYAPEHVRTNQWWPKELVASWQARPSLVGRAAQEQVGSPHLARVLTAMEKVDADPFKGSVERRVMAENQKPSDMELHAARSAMADAKVKPDEIDALLVYSVVPDFLVAPQATLLHHELGLRPDVLTLDTNNACNSFLQHLIVARSLIASGRCRKALLVQSCGALHMCRQQDPYSAWFGDGASAVVVGPVAEGSGILSVSTRTDGSYFRSVVAGAAGKRWYAATEPLYIYNDDRAKAREMFLAVADMGHEVITDALGAIGMKGEEIDFYASHQATPWFRQVTQESNGLTRARSCDTFKWAGNVSACNIPFSLYGGAKESQLKQGDLVAMYSGGSGLSYSGIIMRWTHA